MAAVRQRLAQQFGFVEAVAKRLFEPRAQAYSLEEPEKSSSRLTFANSGMRFS
jgi:CHASE1-domain containing sensor protein